MNPAENTIFITGGSDCDAIFNSPRKPASREAEINLVIRPRRGAPSLN
jgi:hypothetical protein